MIDLPFANYDLMREQVKVSTDGVRAIIRNMAYGNFSSKGEVLLATIVADQAVHSLNNLMQLMIDVLEENETEEEAEEK